MSRQLLLSGIVLLTTGLATVQPAGAGPGYFLGNSVIATSDLSSCSFRANPVACPSYLWFTAVGRLTTPALCPVTIYIRNQHIQFTANGIDYDLVVPDGATTFQGATLSQDAITTFTDANTWSTVLPFPGWDQFYAALAWPVPCPDGLPGSIQNVSWSASFFADKPGASITWTWSAAAYTSFTTSYNLLGVKATDSGSFNPYANSRPAGTPENYRAFLIGGGTGGGGDLYTGSRCQPYGAVSDLPVPVRSSTWGTVKVIYR